MQITPIETENNFTFSHAQQRVISFIKITAHRILKFERIIYNLSVVQLHEDVLPRRKKSSSVKYFTGYYFGNKTRLGLGFIS